MKLYCKLCSHESITSHAGQQGQAAVIDSLMRHIASQHTKAAKELAATIAAASGYLAVRLFGTLPEDETELLGALAKTEHELGTIISGVADTRLRLVENQRGGRGGAN